MKKMICICAVLLLGSTVLSNAQQRSGRVVSPGPTQSSMASQLDSSGQESRPRILSPSLSGELAATANRALIPASELAYSSSVSFHHVWATDVNYGYFQSNGLDLYYEMEGRGKEVVIVVHGCPGIPHDYLHPMLSSLGNYVKVVYFDRRADGLPKGLPRSAMTVASMTEDLDALRESLGLDRVTLLAHGFGGSIALNYALRHPDNVKRLILVGTSAVMESPGDVEQRLIEALSPEEQAAYRDAQENSQSQLERDRKRYRVLYPRCFRKAPDADMLERDTYYIYFDALARRYVLANERSGYDLRRQLGSIRVPALVLAGRHDIVAPLNQSNELAKGLPYSRLAIMEHSGHFPHFEEGYLFSQWVWKFIADTADQASDSKMRRTPTLR